MLFRSGSKLRTERVVVFQKADGEIYGGLEISISQQAGCRAWLSAALNGGIVPNPSTNGSIITSACRNLVFPLILSCWSLDNLWRLCVARLRALSDMSTPRRCRSTSLRADKNSCWKRRGIHPVPVHRTEVKEETREMESCMVVRTQTSARVKVHDAS